ncbi:FAD:protein FMN transferase [Sediminicoccus sp. KRV36]|uniref:FAD:protein FMN transferase n=1 Tax=Sediminicoccus sp. KRV36 TaxID=3133721 RepID=UPI002010902A|nr:FAD:protein FMN transferase [Sediminicoccus rosea]UPY35591.1 FAD:protein FMN transferase [Sediminicoccus rosea]
MVRHMLNGPTMGTRYAAVFFAPDGMATEALAAALFEAVDRVDRQMSSWKPDSDLNRLNAAPIGEWIAIPRELMTVLAEALKIGRATKGAFDIGVGALVEAWGFGPGERRPDRSRIDTASVSPRAVTSASLQLDAAAFRARKSAPLSLDLSGIAKGFGVDEMARVMNSFGIQTWLVGIDGEMRAQGLKPDGASWAVAHERPDRYSRDAMGVIELTDRAVATSGNYRHWVEVAGRVLSHTMDPATQSPLDNGIASVSVLAGTCMAADAWATAFMVLGAEAASSLAAKFGLETIFVFCDGTVRSTV